jgi:hypothetical protein
MRDQNHRHILTLDPWIDARGGRGHPGRIPHNGAGYIQDMDSQVFDDEALAFRQIRLAGKTS